MSPTFLEYMNYTLIKIMKPFDFTKPNDFRNIVDNKKKKRI